MPLILTTDPQIQEQLQKQVQRLLRRGHLQLPVTRNQQVSVAGIIPIQHLQDYDAAAVKTSNPDGYRVLLASGTNVAAALDFFHRKGKLRFAHQVEGAPLDHFVCALNAAEAFYSNKKTRRSPALVDLFLSQQLYLAAFSVSRVRLFGWHDGQLNNLTGKQLSARARRLKNSRKPLTPFTNLNP